MRLCEKTGDRPCEPRKIADNPNASQGLWEQTPGFSHVLSTEDLTSLANSVYAAQRRSEPAPLLEARFYPYSNLNHTIRRRNGKVHLRISDIMRNAPVWALQSITAILLLKLERRRISPTLKRAYQEYADSPEVRDLVDSVRRGRSRKRVSGTAGRVYDLRASFDSLNQRYFDGRLSVSILTWSQGANRRILGHYDRCHDAIVIARSLDRPAVPPVLFEFILFHEMLHAHVGEKWHNGKRYSHHREFKIQERRFESYREAQRLMRMFSVRIR
jgi:ribosomal protein L21E